MEGTIEWGTLKAQFTVDKLDLIALAGMTSLLTMATLFISML